MRLLLIVVALLPFSSQPVPDTHTRPSFVQQTDQGEEDETLSLTQAGVAALKSLLDDPAGLLQWRQPLLTVSPLASLYLAPDDMHGGVATATFVLADWQAISTVIGTIPPGRRGVAKNVVANVYAGFVTARSPFDDERFWGNLLQAFP